MPTRGPEFSKLKQDRGVGEGRRILIFNMSEPRLPVLELSVNPRTFTISRQKKVSTYQTRGASVEEHWPYDELTDINAQGDTLGFADWLPDSDVLGSPDKIRRAAANEAAQIIAGQQDQPDQQNGSTFVWRYVAGPYRHVTEVGARFHELLQLFLNSGARYDSRGIVESFNGLMLIYSGDLYFGYMNTFNFTETADRPFQFTYTFNFRATFSILRS